MAAGDGGFRRQGFGSKTGANLDVAKITKTYRHLITLMTHTHTHTTPRSAVAVAIQMEHYEFYRRHMQYTRLDMTVSHKSCHGTV